MEHRCIEAGQKKSLVTFSNDARERVTLEYFQQKLSSLKSSSSPEYQLTSSIKKYRKSLGSSKWITSFDLQYLNHCLELILANVAKDPFINISVTWSPSETRWSPETIVSTENVSIVGSLPAGYVDVAISPSNICISGSEISSKNMIDTNGSPWPLVRSVRDTHETNCTRRSLDSNLYASPGGFSVLSSPLADGEPEKQKHGSHGFKNRDRSLYTPKILSTYSDLSHGMLQCTWSNGVPHFMFFMDNKPDIYVTRPSTSATSDRAKLDWTYLIYLRSSNTMDSDLVGRMNVSAQYRICADSSKILEMEYVLYGGNKIRENEMSYLSPDLRKNGKFPQKVSKFLKPNHLHKKSPNTKMSGTSTSTGLSWTELWRDEDNKDSNVTKCLNLLENNISSNFELAAIVIKEHIQAEKAEVSGWGMSFLNKAKEPQATSSRPCMPGSSMDILVPAGYHGGPNTRNSGPSSLINRWRSKGNCDCGGWDSGCPITVLNAKPSKDYNKSDIFPKGDDKVSISSMKMVNVQKGLYYIEFQSGLSALQCFSIAVAVIHSNCPTLQPQV